MHSSVYNVKILLKQLNSLITIDTISLARCPRSNASDCGAERPGFDSQVLQGSVCVCWYVCDLYYCCVLPSGSKSLFFMKFWPFFCNVVLFSLLTYCKLCDHLSGYQDNTHPWYVFVFDGTHPISNYMLALKQWYLHSWRVTTLALIANAPFVLLSISSMVIIRLMPYFLQAVQMETSLVIYIAQRSAKISFVVIWMITRACV